MPLTILLLKPKTRKTLWLSAKTSLPSFLWDISVWLLLSPSWQVTSWTLAKSLLLYYQRLSTTWRKFILTEVAAIASRFTMDRLLPRFPIILNRRHRKIRIWSLLLPGVPKTASRSLNSVRQTWKTQRRSSIRLRNKTLLLSPLFNTTSDCRKASESLGLTATAGYLTDWVIALCKTTTTGSLKCMVTR